MESFLSTVAITKSKRIHETKLRQEYVDFMCNFVPIHGVNICPSRYLSCPYCIGSCSPSCPWDMNLLSYAVFCRNKKFIRALVQSGATTYRVPDYINTMTDRLIEISQQETVDQDEYDSTYECSSKATSESEDEDYDMFEDDEQPSSSIVTGEATGYRFHYLTSNMTEMDIN